MKTNELCTDLRIGNWIKYEDKPVQVVQVSSLMILCQRDENSFLVNCEPKVFQPIELNEKILLKIGFNEHDEAMNIYAFENERAVVAYVPNRKLLRIEGVEDGVLIDRNIRLNNIKHLHQLQNAYFLLTGEELEVEL